MEDLRMQTRMEDFMNILPKDVLRKREKKKHKQKKFMEARFKKYNEINNDINDESFKNYFSFEENASIGDQVNELIDYVLDCKENAKLICALVAARKIVNKYDNLKNSSSPNKGNKTRAESRYSENPIDKFVSKDMINLYNNIFKNSGNLKVKSETSALLANVLSISKINEEMLNYADRIGLPKNILNLLEIDNDANISTRVNIFEVIKAGMLLIHNYCAISEYACETICCRQLIESISNIFQWRDSFNLKFLYQYMPIIFENFFKVNSECTIQIEMIIDTLIEDLLYEHDNVIIKDICYLLFKICNYSVDSLQKISKEDELLKYLINLGISDLSDYRFELLQLITGMGIKDVIIKLLSYDILSLIEAVVNISDKYEINLLNGEVEVKDKDKEELSAKEESAIADCICILTYMIFQSKEICYNIIDRAQGSQLIGKIIELMENKSASIRREAFQCIFSVISFEDYNTTKFLVEANVLKYAVDELRNGDSLVFDTAIEAANLIFWIL